MINDKNYRRLEIVPSSSKVAYMREESKHLRLLEMKSSANVMVFDLEVSRAEEAQRMAFHEREEFFIFVCHFMIMNKGVVATSAPSPTEVIAHVAFKNEFKTLPDTVQDVVLRFLGPMRFKNLCVGSRLVNYFSLADGRPVITYNSRVMADVSNYEHFTSKYDMEVRNRVVLFRLCPQAFGVQLDKLDLRRRTGGLVAPFAELM